jgi:hypothetical protein
MTFQKILKIVGTQNTNVIKIQKFFPFPKTFSVGVDVWRRFVSNSLKNISFNTHLQFKILKAEGGSYCHFPAQILTKSQFYPSDILSFSVLWLCRLSFWKNEPQLAKLGLSETCFFERPLLLVGHSHHTKQPGSEFVAFIEAYMTV